MLDSITQLTIIFYVSLSLPIFGIFSLSQFQSLWKEKFILDYFGFFFITFVFVIIAFRPIGDSGFPDTSMYINWFNKSKFENVIETKDIGFGVLIYLSSKILSVRLFFIICTLLSFCTLFWISRIIAGRYWFLFFLGTFVSLYFWNYQVFTIRQGIASVFFLAGFFQKKICVKILFFFLAITFHKSLALPLIAYLLVSIHNKTNFYLLLWLISIPVSFFYGNQLGHLFSLYLPKDIQYYYFHGSKDLTSIQHFRWDVVSYSFIFVIYPFFFKKIDDKYHKIFNIYLVTNIFSILMIWPTGGFIHRFAYLSWFLSPLILYYPLLINKKSIDFKIYFNVLSFFYLLILFYLGLKLYKQDFKIVTDFTIATSKY